MAVWSLKFFSWKSDGNTPVCSWQIFNLRAFDKRAWRLVLRKLPGYKAIDVPQLQKCILCRKWAKMPCGTRRFLALWVPGLETTSRWIVELVIPVLGSNITMLRTFLLLFLRVPINAIPQLKVFIPVLSLRQGIHQSSNKYMYSVLNHQWHIKLATIVGLFYHPCWCVMPHISDYSTFNFSFHSVDFLVWWI